MLVMLRGASRFEDSRDLRGNDEAALRRARQLKMLKPVRLFCRMHAPPIALIVLAAVGTGMQVMLPNIRERVYFTPSPVGDVRAGDDSDDVLELEQLNIWDCKVSKLRKMRVRIFDLDAMIAKRTAMAPGKESSVAGLMRSYGPVNKSAVHALERSNIQKLMRSCAKYFGADGVSDDMPEPEDEKPAKSSQDDAAVSNDFPDVVNKLLNDVIDGDAQAPHAPPPHPSTQHTLPPPYSAKYAEKLQHEAALLNQFPDGVFKPLPHPAKLPHAPSSLQ